MGAPTVTARQLPTGYKMPDGFKTTFANSTFPALNLFEKSGKPPGIDGGEPIETTTMLNIDWRTFAARHLKTLTEITFKCAYDPDVFGNLLNLINRETSWTVHFPTNDSMAFFGVMHKIEFDDLEEGKFPEATVTIKPTNTDPADRSEAAPVYTVASGT